MRRSAGNPNEFSAYWSAKQEDSALETEKNRLTDELKGKINTLKSLTIEIGTEVGDQNKYLKDMVSHAEHTDDDIDNAWGFLGKAMVRVKKIATGSHNHVVLYLLIFSLCVFLFLWLIIKFS